MKKIHFILLLLLLTGPSAAVTPMEYYNSLVAGSDGAGFKDGPFSSARFNEPRGLAFDDSGNKLYVADTRNQRIREISLDENNRVETLAGTGSAGSVDGPIALASFDTPAKLAALPEGRLAVYDAGSGSIRLIDLRHQIVSTLVHDVHVGDMIYRAKDDSLYFSLPTDQKISKLDLKSKSVTDVFLKSAQIPSPGAICFIKDDLLVADTVLPGLYDVKPDEPIAANPSFPLITNLKDVLGLCFSDGHLYALQRGGFLAEVGSPISRTILLPTTWGSLFQNNDHQGSIPLMQLPEIPGGFSVCSDQPRRFFISSQNSVISLKDYDFEDRWEAMEKNKKDLTDFDYPSVKPPRTFRILCIGSSRNSTAVPIPLDPNAAINEDVAGSDLKVNTYSKQLEFMLNTEAALQNSNVHYEVLNFTHRSDGISNWAYYDVPDLVKKYDVDLVIGIVDRTSYKDYYLSPLTSEGIPPEFPKYGDYMQKSLSERAAGSAASDLLRRCKELKIPVSEKQDHPGDGEYNLFCTGDAQMERALEEMAGKRLGLFGDKLNSMKTSSGNTPKLFFFYAPGPFPNDCLEAFWSDTCARYHLNFFDLTDPYNALRVSYYPTVVRHFTPYGNELIARILVHTLIDNKYIHF